MRTPLSLAIAVAFLLNILGPLPSQASELSLPIPGAIVSLSPKFNPPILTGIKVSVDNPFQFDFILNQGSSLLNTGKSSLVDQDLLKEESTKLIKYFLAALTVPDEELWVNLSPYEKDRIVPESFGQTDMGRDLLAQDYLLKQVTASLIYPEGETGMKFWKRVYEEAAKKFGNTDIPVSTFNKVWIVPGKAVIYENAKAGAAYVSESRLSVMLEQDYLALEKDNSVVGSTRPVQASNQLGSQIIREIVIPQLENEVNTGKNFAPLRQMYQSLILAAWYKKKLKQGILNQVYTGRNKVEGINIDNPKEAQLIYEQYLAAFKKGVCNYIKEEKDPVTAQIVPRRYFSGGMSFAMNSNVLQLNDASKGLPAGITGSSSRIIRSNIVASDKASSQAMVVPEWSKLDKPEGVKWQEGVYLGEKRLQELYTFRLIEAAQQYKNEPEGKYIMISGFEELGPFQVVKKKKATFLVAKELGGKAFKEGMEHVKNLGEKTEVYVFAAVDKIGSKQGNKRQFHISAQANVDPKVIYFDRTLSKISSEYLIESLIKAHISHAPFDSLSTGVLVGRGLVVPKLARKHEKAQKDQQREIDRRKKEREKELERDSEGGETSSETPYNEDSDQYIIDRFQYVLEEAGYGASHTNIMDYLVSNGSDGRHIDLWRQIIQSYPDQYPEILKDLAKLYIEILGQSLEDRYTNNLMDDEMNADSYVFIYDVFTKMPLLVQERIVQLGHITGHFKQGLLDQMLQGMDVFKSSLPSDQQDKVDEAERLYLITANERQEYEDFITERLIGRFKTLVEMEEKTKSQEEGLYDIDSVAPRIFKDARTYLSKTNYIKFFMELVRQGRNSEFYFGAVNKESTEIIESIIDVFKSGTVELEEAIMLVDLANQTEVMAQVWPHIPMKVKEAYIKRADIGGVFQACVLSTDPQFINGILSQRDPKEHVFNKTLDFVLELKKFIIERAPDPIDQENYFRQYRQAFRAYARIFKRSNQVLEVEAFEKLAHITYLNFPIILNALSNIKLSISYFLGRADLPNSDIFQLLDHNNSLTRIFRMLGEDANYGGHRVIVNSLIGKKQFGNFYRLMTNLISRWQTQSPQVIDGTLIILSRFDPEQVKNMTSTDWQEFESTINEYFQQGFKVFDARLFKYFMKNRNKPDAIVQFREDVLRETRNIAWGDFYGFTDEFMNKYGLTAESGVALIGRYIPIKNQTARDYSGMFTAIKMAIRQRIGWRDEVDAPLRQLFEFTPTRLVRAYSTDVKPDLTVYALLEGLAKEPVLRLEDRLREFKDKPLTFAELKDEDKIKCLIDFVFRIAQIDRSDFMKNKSSESDQAKFDWLSNWVSFLNDAKLEHKPRLDSMVRQAVLEMSQESRNGLKVVLKMQQFRFLDFDASKMVPRTRGLLEVFADAKLTHDQKIQKLSDELISKLKQFPAESLRNAEKMMALGDSMANMIVQSYQREEKNQVMAAEEIRTLVTGAFVKARASVLQDLGDKTDEDRIAVIMAGKISFELIGLIKKQSSLADQELNKFVVREVPAEGNVLKVGFFDDLLHLMGFMASGVCTWVVRDKQVADTNVHFGKIAIKDENGRVLGASQVQLSRTPIKGQALKQSTQGWSIMALPGINLFHEQLLNGQSTRQLVLSILESAQAYAKETGMQGAVLPMNGAINSNHNQEKKVINELVSLGWLKPVELQQEVILSAKPAPEYAYSHVYLIAIPENPQEFFVRKSRTVLQSQEDQQMARLKMMDTHTIADEFIMIPKIRDLTLPQGRKISRTINDILSTIPTAALNAARSAAVAQDAIVEMRVNEQMPKSSLVYTSTGIIVEVGQDILLDKSADARELKKVVAELIVALMLGKEEYVQLNMQARTNENARLKLGIMQALILYKDYSNTPIIVKQSVQGIETLDQWNVFLSVMDNADPNILIGNYLGMLYRDKDVSNGKVSTLLLALKDLDVLKEVSLAELREAFRAFILGQQTRISINHQEYPIEMYSNFDQQEELKLLNQILLSTQNQTEFYSTLSVVLEKFIPNQYVKVEIGRLFQGDIFTNAQRPQALKSALSEIVVRFYGQKTFDAIFKHLTAAREGETIPYVRFKDKDLNVGDNLDHYEFLEFIPGAEGNYDLFIDEDGQGSKKSSAQDWVRSLFNMDQAMAVHREGGIDFKNVVPEIRSEEDGQLLFNIDPAMLQTLQNAPGLKPVIIDILPMTDLNMFLGLKAPQLTNTT